MENAPGTASKDTKRDRQILEILEANGPASVHDLCQKLYLSEATIRRALSSLARKGLIHRTHGGAELLKTKHLSSIKRHPTTANSAV